MNKKVQASIGKWFKAIRPLILLIVGFYSLTIAFWALWVDRFGYISQDVTLTPSKNKVELGAISATNISQHVEILSFKTSSAKVEWMLRVYFLSEKGEMVCDKSRSYTMDEPKRKVMYWCPQMEPGKKRIMAEAPHLPDEVEKIVAHVKIGHGLSKGFPEIHLVDLPIGLIFFCLGIYDIWIVYVKKENFNE